MIYFWVAWISGILDFQEFTTTGTCSFFFHPFFGDAEEAGHVVAVVRAGRDELKQTRMEKGIFGSIILSIYYVADHLMPPKV